jgi:type VI secretion system FHA domain protein
MILTLEVTGPQASTLGPARRKVFGAEGGSIGRLPDNDWVLADPYVSGRHAIIRFVDGAFYIEDTSRNGVFVNSPEDRVLRGQPHIISSGDRILIDPYEIEAQITRESTDDDRSPVPIDNPFLPSDVFADQSLAPLQADPLQALRLEPNRESQPRGRSVEPDQAPWSDEYRAPRVETPKPVEVIPANWDKSNSAIIPAPGARPAPSVSQSRPATPRDSMSSPRASRAPGSTDLSALLQAAGMNEASASPELARDLGQVFRVVVSGVMDVLKARQQTKDQFGLGMTSFKRADNNPLKFSTDVEDAMRTLFEHRHNTKYLGPVDAFEDAFEDMRNHQIAMLVGVRVAFEAMLSEFHPDHLQEHFDRQVKKGALVSIPARLRYWDLYREWIHDMVRDADTSFRELFGDEFARAYEEQLKRMKAQGRAEKS